MFEDRTDAAEADEDGGGGDDSDGITTYDTIRLMTDFESKIYEAVSDNSFLFLKESLGRLLERDAEFKQIDNQLLTLTCAELQIALELAVRAVVIRRFGIAGVLKDNQKKLGEEEIIEHYKRKTLKVEDFEKLKNYLKKNNETSLLKQEFLEIERFQQYRNKIVHFACEFSEEELSSLRNDILYYVVHVILVLLSEETTGETPTEYLQRKLGDDFYKKLKKYRPYIRAMDHYADRMTSPVWTCIGCSQRTYSPEFDYCYICGYETLTGYKRVDCASCGTKNSVIYDHLDIHNEGNHHTINGMCLNCDEKTEVFECPECGVAHDVLLDYIGGDYCCEGHCVNKD